jgi:hypothetical protein
LQAEGTVLSRVETSEFDAGGFESDELVGESPSSHPETGMYVCRAPGSDEIRSQRLAETMQYCPKLMLG